MPRVAKFASKEVSVTHKLSRYVYVQDELFPELGQSKYQKCLDVEIVGITKVRNGF